jgi:hypothetical protein
MAKSATPRKGDLFKKIAKASGTTVGEAKGVVKQARQEIRSGDSVAGYRTLRKALTGGPSAGVPKSRANSAMAIKKARQTVSRIQKKRAAK